MLKNDSKRAQFQKEGLDLDSEYEGVFQERVKKTELNKKFNDDVRTILEHGNKFSSQLLDNNLVFKMGKNNVTDVMTRKPIGYVMYSKIDCSIRKYAGKGFVTAEGFKEILKRDRLCLVKEKSGVKFFFCKVEELSYY